MCSVLYLIPFFRVLWRVGDEGTLVHNAVRVAEGEIPYRDFFEVMAPGTFFALSWFFKLFGAGWAVSRLYLLLGALGILLLLLHLAWKLRPGPRALYPAFFYLAISFPKWPAVSHHWDSTLAALASFALFIHWTDKRNTASLAAAGLLAGVTTCFVQQKGVLLFAGYLVLVAWSLYRRPDMLRSLAGLTAAYSIPGLALVAYFYSVGAASHLFYANVTWPLEKYHNVNVVPYAYFLGRHFDNAQGAGFLLAGFVVLPLIAVAALPGLLAILRLLGRASEAPAQTLPFWVSGAALWLSELHRADMPHLIYGSPVLIVLACYLFERARFRGRTLALWVFTASLAVFAAGNLYTALSARIRIETRRGAVYAHQPDEALAHIQSAAPAGSDIFVYPYYPMYYYLTATRNPTRYSILMYRMNSASQFQEVMRSLEAGPTRHVLWDTAVSGDKFKEWFPKYTEPPREERLLDNYLAERYQSEGVKNGFRILERK